MPEKPGTLVDGLAQLAEVERFDLGRPIGARGVGPDLLRSLHLACLSGATTVRVRRLACHEAFTLLFTAALHGGAGICTRHCAPRSRLMAFEALADLIDVPCPASIEELETTISQASWSFFEPTYEDEETAGPPSGSWFTREWDIGLLAIPPDGRTLTVLAATSTD